MKPIYRAGVERREFKLFKALLKEMYHTLDDKVEIDNANELRIKIDS